MERAESCRTTGTGRDSVEAPSAWRECARPCTDLRSIHEQVLPFMLGEFLSAIFDVSVRAGADVRQHPCWCDNCGAQFKSGTPSPPKRARGLASPWSPSTPSTPSSPSTWRSPAPPVLLPGEAVAESLSSDGSRSVRAVQFPGAVILRYFDIRSGQLQLRGAARAKGPAEPEDRFDDADPDPSDSCAAHYKTPPRDIVRRILTAPSEVPS